MSDDELRSLVSRHGVSGKLVREVCKRMGWRRCEGDNGAPSAWYVAFRGELGAQLERVLA